MSTHHNKRQEWQTHDNHKCLLHLLTWPLSIGALTAHTQQILLIEQEWLNNNIQSPRAPNPCGKCIRDLATFIQNLQKRGDSVIICIDANKTS